MVAHGKFKSHSLFPSFFYFFDLILAGTEKKFQLINYLLDIVQLENCECEDCLFHLFQMNSTFLLQGLHMRISIFNDTDDSAKDLSVVPPAWLSLVDISFVLILIPIMDKWIYPWLDRKGWSPSVFTRISIGKFSDLH